MGKHLALLNQPLDKRGRSFSAVGLSTGGTEFPLPRLPFLLVVSMETATFGGETGEVWGAKPRAESIHRARGPGGTDGPKSELSAAPDLSSSPPSASGPAQRTGPSKSTLGGFLLSY